MRSRRRRPGRSDSEACSGSGISSRGDGTSCSSSSVSWVELCAHTRSFASASKGARPVLTSSKQNWNSVRAAGCDRLDLLAIHGINLPDHLEQTLRPGAAWRWCALAAENRGHVGFSVAGVDVGLRLRCLRLRQSAGTTSPGQQPAGCDVGHGGVHHQSHRQRWPSAHAVSWLRICSPASHRLQRSVLFRIRGSPSA